MEIDQSEQFLYLSGLPYSKSEQIAQFLTNYLAKNPDSGSEESDLTRSQSSRKNHGPNERRFLQQMEKLRSKHAKKKTVEKRRKSLMPKLSGFRDLNSR